MTAQADKIASIFRSVAQIPVLTSARITKSRTSIIIDSSWSLRNLIRNKIVKLSRTYVLDTNLVVSASSHAEKNSELLVATSPSESSRAIVLQCDSESKEKAKQFIEIWKNGQLQHCFDVSALDVHGDIYADSEFASLEWAPCEKKLLYIAEKKRPKSEPFFKVKPQSNNEKDNDSDNGPTTKGEEFVYQEEWGENLVGKVKSVIVTLKLCEEAKEVLSVTEQIPDYLCPAQAIWAPDGSIVGVAWETRPRKLGLIYCTNRKSCIFRISSKGDFSILSEEGKAVRSPRFSPDGKFLVWIERQTGGPHLSTHTLMKLAWPPTQESCPTIIIDNVNTSIPTANGKSFCGLYALELPNRCWLSDSNLLFSTVQWNEVKSYIVNIETNCLFELISNNEGEYSTGSLSVLDVKDGMILSSWSSIQCPPQLLIGKLNTNDDSAQITWVPVSKPDAVPEVENYFVEYLNLQHKTNEAVNECSAIYYGNRDTTGSKYGALLVWPHGGPHSAFTNSFSPATTFFALLGFSIVQVNFRGSIGQGKASVDFLLGRVGDSDVRDCRLATETCIEKFACDANRCVLFGGSHGGFLVTHLSGQYPDAYKAVVARNAVIDISTMLFISDIPDWCAVEIGSSFTEQGPVNEEMISKMRKASPIEHAHKVKAPTLLMVGSKDLRVPPSQSILYYHRLKANNCPVKMMLYEDNHPLAKAPVMTDNLINSAIWLAQYSGIIL